MSCSRNHVFDVFSIVTSGAPFASIVPVPFSEPALIITLPPLPSMLPISVLTTNIEPIIGTGTTVPSDSVAYSSSPSSSSLLRIRSRSITYPDNASLLKLPIV